MRGETQDVRTSVKNGHTFPMRITLVDRLPLSAASRSPSRRCRRTRRRRRRLVDDKPGVFGWTYDYKPGEQSDVRLGWQARWPIDRELRRQ